MSSRAHLELARIVRPGTRWTFLRSRRSMITGLAFALLPLNACGGESPTDPVTGEPPTAAVVSVDTVLDLAVTATTEATITVGWTAVGDGSGNPARYRLKYALPAISWASAEVGCDVEGRAIGTAVSCTIEGLDAGTRYDFQLMSYRLRGRSWQGAVYSNVVTGETTRRSASTDTAAPGAAGRVDDLRVTHASGSTLSVSWTQVDGGTGEPARYRVKYADPPIAYASATTACDVVGDRIGAETSCTIDGLAAGTTYEVQLAAYRLVEGTWSWTGTTSSNIATGRTGNTSGVGSDLAASTRGGGIWIGADSLARMPTSGAAWTQLLSDAGRDPGSANIADMHSNHDSYTLAAALVCARTGSYCAKARQGVLDAIGTEDAGRWLEVGRNLGSYVIAADLLGLRADGNSGSAGTRVEQWIRGWLTKRLPDNVSGVPRGFGPFHSGANAAAQEGFAFTAVAAYLGDDVALQRAWDAFRTFACDATAPDREGIYLDKVADDGWAHDDRAPCAINPAGTVKVVPSGRPGSGQTRRIDGAIGGDMRRGGLYQWEPGYTQYPWVGLEGLVPAAMILHRAGYPAFRVSDRAVLRTHEYLWFLRTSTGDQAWFDGIRAREVVQLVNHAYGTSFPVNRVVGAGRTVGYTDWTHPR